MRSDGGGEFISKGFESLLLENGIRHNISYPNSPHQNGTAERHWRTFFKMGKCLLKQGSIRKEFWPYAVMAAAYIRNRCYSKHLQKTPYHAMTERKPNLSNMRTFGSECFGYKEKRSKLDDRCTKGIFVGYDNSSPSYLVLIPETNKVMKYSVKFPIKKVIEQQTETESTLFDTEEAILFRRHITSDHNPNSARITNADKSQGEEKNDKAERSARETEIEQSNSQAPSGIITSMITSLSRKLKITIS